MADKPATVQQPLRHPGLRGALLCLLPFSLPIQAQPPAAGEMLWSCVSVDDGQEWECSVNEETPSPEQTASETEAGETAEPTPAAETAATPPATDTRPQPGESAAGAQPDALAEDEFLREYHSEQSRPLTMEPTTPPTRERQSKTPWQQPALSQNRSRYECQAKGDSWDCNEAPQPLKTESYADGDYLGAYPDAYADNTQPVEHAPAVESAGRSEQQWDCRASDDQQGWDCQPLPAATAAPRSRMLASTTAPAANPYAYLDWYDFEDGPDPVTHCPGRYIAPAPRYTQEELAQGEQPTYIQADRSRTQQSSITRLEGNIHLQKGNQQLRSQRAELDHDNDRAEFQGLVLFREPGTLVLGNSAVFDQAQGQTLINDAQFVMHERHARGSADSVVHYDSGNTYIRNGSYTTCEPGNNGWSLNSAEIALYQDEGVGIAKHATLRVADVPILYLPVISFPIDDRRKSGFLIPSFSISEDNGVDITAPYYFNLAPHYDLTLAPRYVEKRGLMLEGEFRYLLESGQYDFSMATLPGDDLRNDEDRWVLGIQHSGRPAANWSSSIDFTRVSDNDYFDDLDSSLNISQETHLDQRGALAYHGGGWNFTTLVHSYQTITDASAPYRKLPQLRLDGSRFFNEDALELSYLAEYTDFDRDISGFSGIDRITGSRLHLDTAIANEYRWPWAYIKPKLRLTHTTYRIDNQPSGFDDNPSRTLPLFSVDSALYLERDTEFGGQAYLHTLEPRVFYLYVPEENQDELPDFDASELTFSYSQLFRDNRFSGQDRIGDTNQVTLGLTSRLLKDNGQELLHASIGQIFYLEDREVGLRSSSPVQTDSTSDLAAAGLWNISNHLRLTADGQWDNDDLTNLKRNLKLSYRSDLDHQFNIGYRFTRDDLEQSDISMIWPLSAQWSVLARWLQDIENHESLDRVFGLEYENCCWKVRTLYREWIDDDAEDRENKGIFLQFTMKGLGTFGTKAAGDSGPKAKSFLEDIIGFESRENSD